MENITQYDVDNMKDIYWFIKGYVLKNNPDNIRNDFENDHLIAVYKAIELMNESKEKETESLEKLDF